MLQVESNYGSHELKVSEASQTSGNTFSEGSPAVVNSLFFTCTRYVFVMVNLIFGVGERGYAMAEFVRIVFL